MMNLYVILTLILGAALRFYNNTAVSLWHDEAFSALYIRYPWGEMMHRIILDVHPPLYYIILRFWSYVFGSSLLSLRGMSILFGVATIWAGYLLVKQGFKNRKWALLSAIFLAINPFQIQYSLEARMYTLGTFLVLYSSYILLKALEQEKLKYWIWYGILASAALYTHYYLVFSVLAQGLFVIYYLFKFKKFSFAFSRANQFYKSMGSYILAFILYVPWLPSFLEQNKRVSGGYWITPPDAWSMPGTIWKMAFGGQGINRPTLVIATVVSLAVLAYFVYKVQNWQKWMIALGLVVPFLGALALSMKTAIYLDRYFVFASLFFSIMLALAFAQLERKTFRNLLIAAFIGASVFAFFKNWKDMDVKNLFFDRQVNRKPGMAAAAEFVNESALPHDRIYVASSFIFFTYKYYNHTGITPLLISDRPVEQIPHYAGTAIMSNDDLILNFQDTPKNTVVWLVWTTGFGGSKPNVPGNWSRITEKDYPDTPGFKGDILVTQYRVN
jgi:mannosyltransferase